MVDFLLVDAEDVLGEGVAVGVDVLGRVIQQVGFGLGVVAADAAAGLDRHRGDAVVFQVEGDHVVGLLESLFDPFPVAEFEIDAQVPRDAVPQSRRVRGQRLDRVGDRVQGLIVDIDEVQGVARDPVRFGDHQGHRLADVAHPVDGQAMARGFRQLRSVAVLPHRRFRRHRTEPLGDPVLAGDHQKHAFHGQRLRGVDVLDLGMGINRAQHRGPGLAFEVDVVDIPAAAGEEPLVLGPSHRLADGDVGHAPPPLPFAASTARPAMTTIKWAR